MGLSPIYFVGTRRHKKHINLGLDLNALRELNQQTRLSFSGGLHARFYVPPPSFDRSISVYCSRRSSLADRRKRAGKWKVNGWHWRRSYHPGLRLLSFGTK